MNDFVFDAYVPACICACIVYTWQDVAGAVLFLSSPGLARHVSGQTITVAGGMIRLCCMLCGLSVCCIVLMVWCATGMEGRQLWLPSDVNEDAVRARLKEQ